MKEKFIIFDFDGTIADTKKITVRGLQKSLDFLPGEYIEEYFYTSLHCGLDVIIQNLLLENNRNPEEYLVYLRNAQEVFSDYYNSFGVPTFEGLVNCLKYLRSKNYKTAICTNRLNTKIFYESYNKSELTQYFDFIICSGSQYKEKPDTEMLDVIKSFFKCGKNEMVIIGDSKNDILAGNDFGIETIGVTWGYSSFEDLQKHNPVHIVNNFGELNQLLN
jgi:phosphoglycolate phosphatase